MAETQSIIIMTQQYYQINISFQDYHVITFLLLFLQAIETILKHKTFFLTISLLVRWFALQINLPIDLSGLLFGNITINKSTHMILTTHSKAAFLEV